MKKDMELKGSVYKVFTKSRKERDEQKKVHLPK